MDSYKFSMEEGIGVKEISFKELYNETSLIYTEDFRINFKYELQPPPTLVRQFL